MDSVSIVGAPSRSIADANPRPRATASWSARLLRLSSWMLILGTVRALCLSADFILTLQDSLRASPMPARVLASALGDNQMFLLVAGVWPLALGIALWKTGWSSLIKPAAVTFLMLGAIGALKAGMGWIHQSRSGLITVGSFHLHHAALVKPSGTDLLLGLLGIAQILAELATGVYALRLETRAGSVDGMAYDAARRARMGRLALYASLGFAVLLIRIPAWSAYLEVVTQSNWFRDYVLNNDLRSRRSFGGFSRGVQPQSQENKQLGELSVLLNAGLEANGEHQYFAARDNYIRAAKLAEMIPQSSPRSPLRNTLSTCFNNLAWLLATCPDPSIRDAKGAVQYAKRAVEIAPKDGNFWNTLGVAYYRAGEWEEAKDALYRSMELRNEGDSFDWFFLGLVHLKLGDPKRARDWYDRSVDWFHRYRPDDEELYQFHVEASSTLGLPKPAMPPPRPRTNNTLTENDLPFPLQRRFRNRSLGFPHVGGANHQASGSQSESADPSAPVHEDKSPSSNEPRTPPHPTAPTQSP